MRTTLIFGTFAALLGIVAVAKANNGSESGNRAASQVTGEVASATGSEGLEQDKRKDLAPKYTDKLRVQERALEEGREDREDRDSR
jgi:hypothetical protein